MDRGQLFKQSWPRLSGYLDKILYLRFVKKLLSTFFLFHLIFLYSFSSAVYSKIAIASEADATELQYHPHQTELSAQNWLAPCHPLKNLIASAAQPIHLSFQLFHFDFVAYLHSSERVFLSTFVQYRFFFRYAFRHFGSKEIIFPFHSFW